jgi:hypothetical protein
LRLVRGLVRPTTLGVVGFLFTTATSALALAIVSLSFEPSCRLRQQVVVHGSASRAAMLLGLVGGVAGAIAVPLVRKRPKLLFGSLAGGVAILALGLALLAADSGTYVQHVRFSDCPAETDTTQLGFLYSLWGAPLVVLLVQALRVLREARRD